VCVFETGEGGWGERERERERWKLRLRKPAGALRRGGVCLYKDVYMNICMYHDVCEETTEYSGFRGAQNWLQQLSKRNCKKHSFHIQQNATHKIPSAGGHNLAPKLCEWFNQHFVNRNVFWKE
jgi:hypothetical protein